MLIEQVVFEEVCNMQGPLDIDLLTVGTLEDGAYRVMSINQGLRVREAPRFGNPRSRRSGQGEVSENELYGEQGRIGCRFLAFDMGASKDTFEQAGGLDD